MRGRARVRCVATTAAQGTLPHSFVGRGARMPRTPQRTPTPPRTPWCTPAYVRLRPALSPACLTGETWCMEASLCGVPWGVDESLSRGRLKCAGGARVKRSSGQSRGQNSGRSSGLVRRAMGPGNEQGGAPRVEHPGGVPLEPSAVGAGVRAGVRGGARAWRGCACAWRPRRAQVPMTARTAPATY